MRFDRNLKIRKRKSYFGYDWILLKQREGCLIPATPRALGYYYINVEHQSKTRVLLAG